MHFYQRKSRNGQTAKRAGRQARWVSSGDKLAGAAKAAEGERLATAGDKQLPWMGQKG